MFIAALLTVAKAWRQPKCLLMEDWVKKVWYVCAVEYFSAIRWNIAICNNMDGP